MSKLMSCAHLTPYTRNRFIMVSKDDQGHIGSIYTERGRLRLIHEDGPALEEESGERSTARWNLLPEEVAGAPARFCGGSRGKSLKWVAACKTIKKQPCLNDERTMGPKRLPNNVRIPVGIIL